MLPILGSALPALGSFVASNWRLLAFAGLLAVVGVQTWRLDRSQSAYASLRAEYEQFQGGVRALGEKAKADAALREAADKLKKEKADAENARTRRDLAGLYDAYRKLRDSRTHSGGGLVPPAAAGSASPATAAFDRSALDRALSGFDSGVTGLLEEGDKAIADLNTAREWARGR